MKTPTMTYDARTRVALFTNSNGVQLKLSNVSESQARTFCDAHGAAWAERGFVLQTDGPGAFSRALDS